jgi:hypothetical protein
MSKLWHEEIAEQLWSQGEEEASWYMLLFGAELGWFGC